MEALAADKRSLLLTTVFILWDSQGDRPVLYEMEDPEDHVRKPCLLLFPSVKLLRSFKEGKYADEERYPSLRLDNKKAQSFLEEAAKFKIVPILALEDEGKVRLRRLLGACTAPRA